MTTQIVLVAGEASGDRLGAALIQSLRAVLPDCDFSGIGGPMMADEGMDCWYPASDLALMGFAEVVGELPRLLRLRRQFIRRVLSRPPACYIGIDAPDFNLGVEKRLKRAGITTIQYVSPSVWAWRRGRARKIGRSADLVLTLFPFEPAIYREFDVDARFVGHPTADQIPLHPDKPALRQQLGLAGSGTTVAVLPGSRMGEIRRLGQIFLDACQIMSREMPDLRFVSPCASEATRLEFQRMVDATGEVDMQLLDGRSLECLGAADAALLASGTAALEALLCKTPMVVSYRISPITHWIVHTFGLMKVERYSLPNALADSPLVPEVMQKQATPENLATEMLTLLRSEDRQNHMLQQFTLIHQQLKQDASRAAAAAVAELLSRGNR
ncbi:MAG: lipid-A-disaccharide synthase [Xanthomonadales bacterium]|nr:lipid-A-disaccharide synthase [Xanthomonadales bacterium]